MNCEHCKKHFNRLAASCGTGVSWLLFCCPHCGQLQAEILGEDGFFPQEVIDNESILKLSKGTGG